MFLLFTLIVLVSSTEFSCHIRVFENTDEPIVMEFICPYQEIEQCKTWFENQDGTIQQCWQYDDNHIRYPYLL